MHIGYVGVCTNYIVRKYYTATQLRHHIYIYSMASQLSSIITQVTYISSLYIMFCFQGEGQVTVYAVDQLLQSGGFSKVVLLSGSIVVEWEMAVAVSYLL